MPADIPADIPVDELDWPTPARPEPVLDAARLAGLTSALVSAVGAVVVLAELATTAQVEQWAVAVGGVVMAGVALVSYLAPVWQARKARALVTPLSSPQDDAGHPLIALPGKAR